METYDTYCLIPERTELIRPLDLLFYFDDVVYHDGVIDHPIRSASEAANAFSNLLRDGDFIRFQDSKIDRTEGGWLYRLEDGSPVIGLSGDVDVSGAVFRQLLEAAIPNCQCCTLGDQPPPSTTTEFMRLAEAQS